VPQDGEEVPAVPKTAHSEDRLPSDLLALPETRRRRPSRWSLPSVLIDVPSAQRPRHLRESYYAGWVGTAGHWIW
jgi:hypothetical protein